MILLLSGGIDSASILIRHRESIDVALFVDYGHAAAWQEHLHASRMAERCGIKYQKIQANIKLGQMGGHLESNPMVVPARNAILLSLAANRYPGVGIFHGAIRADAEHYADCRRPFFDAMQVALGVPILTPNINASKYGLKKIVNAAAIDAFSCYSPLGGEPCKKCNSCKESGNV